MNIFCKMDERGYFALRASLGGHTLVIGWEVDNQKVYSV